MTVKKPPKKSTAKRGDTSSRESVAALKKTIDAQEKTIAAQAQEIREAAEHQTATAEVLSIISRSPTDVQPVLDAIVESAARVCGIDDVLLQLHEGTLGLRGLILVPYPSAASRAV